MAYISLYDSTSSSLTVRLSGMDTSYNQVGRIASWYLNNSSLKTQNLNNGISQSPTVTWTGLNSSTTYAIKCVVTGVDNNGNATQWNFSASFTTDSSGSGGGCGSCQSILFRFLK